MLFKDVPIQKKLMRIIFLISGIILIVISSAFFGYEFYAFRLNITQKLSVLGKVIATNSTAALAFDDHDNASEILLALKAEPRIIAAALYDTTGALFSKYPANLAMNELPVSLSPPNGFHFRGVYVEGFQVVTEGDRRLGTLYLKSNLEGMYKRLGLLGITIMVTIAICLLVAYILSKLLQKSISIPILSLSKTAEIISVNKDYSVRAIKYGTDEMGSLTDSFNDMLQQIEQLNAELERKVIARTEELQTVNKELEAFSYSVSHDLRTPLRAINGFAKMLNEEYSSAFDNEARRLFGRIEENAKKMGTLIDDLLEFSKLGRKEIHKSSIQMTELTEATLSELNNTINHEAAVTIHPLHTAHADATMIKQVMVNLLSNAVKYSSKTVSPLIEVKSQIKSDEIIYSVSDNGVGFNNQYTDKLFGVFQRLHLQKDFEGTGVGLALVKRIIDKHGGRVWAKGELNKGATFFFSLPVTNKEN